MVRSDREDGRVPLRTRSGGRRTSAREPFKGSACSFACFRRVSYAAAIDEAQRDDWRDTRERQNAISNKSLFSTLENTRLRVKLFGRGKKFAKKKE